MINSTKNYEEVSKNKYQPSHRPRPSKDMIQSIKETNGNILCPALVDDDMNILDGHRRLQACIDTNTYFYYMKVSDLVDIKPERIMLLLNTTGRQWNTMQYMEFHSGMNIGYKLLLEFINDNKIPFSLITSFAGILSTTIQNGGSFEIDYKDLERKIKVYNIVSGYYPSVLSTQVHRTLAKLYKIDEFNDKTLIEKLEIYFGNSESSFKLDKNAFLKELCKVYDYKTKTKKGNLEAKLLIKGII